MNALLLLIILAIFGAAYCLRKSPNGMLWLASRLMATAEADKEREIQYRKLVKLYDEDLGIQEAEPVMVEN